MRDMEATEQITLPGMHVLYPEVILIINVQLKSSFSALQCLALVFGKMVNDITNLIAYLC